jgi:hypothetical protein
MATTLAARNEDDVALACIGVVVLQNEELVHPIFLKSCNLDYSPDWANKTLVEDNVLLSTDLGRMRCKLGLRHM